MLANEALEIALAPDSSKGAKLEALGALGSEKLSSGLIALAISRVREKAEIHEDLAAEIEALGKFALDCSGTGGSGLVRFNTSTALSILLAACGFKVAKFGAKASSGSSGSFDFLASLGLAETLLPVSQIADALSVCGVAFIYAGMIYPSLKELAPLRKELGKPTVFNFIGPLLNPVSPSVRIMGVSCHNARKLLAEYLLAQEKSPRALLVTGENNLDEFSPYGQSKYFIIENGEIIESSFQAQVANEERCELESPAASNLAMFNAKTFLKIAAGEDSQSDAYRSLVLNAGAAIFLLKGASSIEEGLACAQETIASGDLAETLATCRRFYAKLSG